MTAVQGEPLAANEGTGTGWTVDDSEFGARLALVRQRMQWNIKEAARECDVPAASWGSWEAGSMPRRYAEICDKIANRTGADFMWLMAGSSRSAAAPRTTGRYPDVADQPAVHTSRPRDNRPPSRPAPVPANTGGRTAYLDRGNRRRPGR